MTESPLERTSRVRVATQRGWIEGTLRLPRAAPLEDWLGREDHRFLTLTDVRIGSLRLPYLSLRKSAVRLVVPPDGEPSPRRAGEPHRVAGLLADGSIVGTLDVRSSVRVSDYLAHHEGFVVLHGAAVHRQDMLAGEERIQLPTLIVALDALLGIAEEA